MTAPNKSAAGETAALTSTQHQHDDTRLAAALDLIAGGIPVIPLHSPVLVGNLFRCSCGHDCDKDAAKHPRCPHGLSDASLDPPHVRWWWQRWPEANVGLVLPAWLVVVDVDHADGLAVLHAEGLDLPATAMVRTGRGAHYYYSLPAGVVVRPGVRFRPHVDLRKLGNYVVAPPSRHITGHVYTWDTSLDETADAPAWLVGLGEREGERRPGKPVEKWRRLVAEGVGEGGRNAAVASLAGKLLYQNVDPFVILDLCLCWNETRCRPPLPDDEVVETVNSVASTHLRRNGGAA